MRTARPSLTWSKDSRSSASLPDGLERVRLELALQHTLGVTLMATRGYAAPEVVAAYGRARALCQEAGETPLLFSVLVGLWRFYFTQGALTTTRGLTAELLRMAGDAGDPAPLLEARQAEAMVSFYLGELVTTRDSAAEGIGIYDVREHGSHALVYGQDPGTNCLSCAAWSLLLLGYPEQSRRKSDDMLALSEAVSHPLTRARALVMCAIFHYFRREPDAVRERIEAAMALAVPSGSRGGRFPSVADYVTGTGASGGAPPAGPRSCRLSPSPKSRQQSTSKRDRQPCPHRHAPVTSCRLRNGSPCAAKGAAAAPHRPVAQYTGPKLHRRPTRAVLGRDTGALGTAWPPRSSTGPPGHAGQPAAPASPRDARRLTVPCSVHRPPGSGRTGSDPARGRLAGWSPRGSSRPPARGRRSGRRCRRASRG